MGGRAASFEGTVARLGAEPRLRPVRERSAAKCRLEQALGACSRDWGPLQRQWGRPVAVQPFWCRSETSRLVAQAELWALATALLGSYCDETASLTVQSAVMKPCGPCAAPPHT